MKLLEGVTSNIQDYISIQDIFFWISVDFIFIATCLKLSVCVLTCLVVSDSLPPHGLLCPWDFPGKNTGVRCHFLLQEIFLTQGSNLHLLNYRQILFITQPLGKPPQLDIWTLFCCYQHACACPSNKVSIQNRASFSRPSLPFTHMDKIVSNTKIWKSKWVIKGKLDEKKPKHVYHRKSFWGNLYSLIVKSNFYRSPENYVPKKNQKWWNILIIFYNSPTI